MLSLTVQRKIQPFRVLALISKAFPNFDLNSIQFQENDDGSTTIGVNTNANGQVIKHDFSVAEAAITQALL